MNSAKTANPKSTLKRMFIGGVLGAVVGVWWARLHQGTPETPHNFHELISNFERRGFTPGLIASLVLLVIFSIYWEAAAKNSSQNKTAESRFSRGIHLALLSVGQLALLIPIPGIRWRFLPSSTALVVAGLILETAGVLFAVWARQTLGLNWNAAVALKVDQELVRSGPYRFVRHPIYSGLLGIYLGVAIVSGGALALVGLALIGLAYWRKIRLEEQYLTSMFGPSYDEYRHSTKAVVPGLL